MRHMNTIHVAGRLGADPEVRFTPNGQKVTSFRIASNQKKAGKEVTIWWRITVWGERFDKMMSYIKKGTAIFVVGILQEPKTYQDRNGQTQISLEITAEMLQFSPFGRSQQDLEAEMTGSNANQVSFEQKESEGAAIETGQMNSQGSDVFSEEEIPF